MLICYYNYIRNVASTMKVLCANDLYVKKNVLFSILLPANLQLCKLGFGCVQESARLRLYQLLLPLPRPGASTSTSRADTRAALAPHNHQHHHWLRTLGLESRGHLSPGLRHARICPALALERARAGRQSRGVCCRVFIIMGGEG